MSDERLRALERRWRETGSVEDEASLLLHRVRTGELTEERLALAACCGQAGARMAMHGAGSSAVVPGDRGELLALLERGGPWMLAAAAVAAASKAVDSLGASALPDLRRLLALAEAAVHLRDRERVPEALEVYRHLDRHFYASAAALHDDPRWRACSAVLAAFRAATGRHHAARTALDDAAFVAGEAVVREHVLVAAGSWAIGSRR